VGEAFSTGLILPAICLAALGWTVPRVLAIFWPEGVKWLMGLALASTLSMALCGAVFFAVLYTSQGVNLDDLYATGGLSVPLHFAKLSLISALLWAPLMVLSLAGVPKNWVREVW
jgi:hypothetical protein